jgi:hypothetical protein
VIVRRLWCLACIGRMGVLVVLMVLGLHVPSAVEQTWSHRRGSEGSEP